ncbi:MAG: hypothetical protein WBL19_02740 [Minisyncoccia bacterium]
MELFSNIRETVTDFLFPKSKRVLELEALSAPELLKTLPGADKPERGNVWAIFSYENTLVKELVWELKYSGNKVIAAKLGEILFDFLKNKLAEEKIFDTYPRPLVVPIPIPGKRLFERGWNQAELLVAELKKRDPEHVFKYLSGQLVKARYTESQTKTSTRAERAKNLKDSMRILNPASVAGSCVAVIDDVTTTGSTFAEAERALKAAGAKKVLGIAIAH